MRVALVLVACALATASADAPTLAARRDQRVAYIAKLLEAIRASDPTTLANVVKYITAVERNNCRAPEQNLRLGCLLEAVAQNCKQRDAAARERCQLISDVIVTNRLSEPIFIPKDVRYRLLDEHRDFKLALARELRAQYATRAAELAMSRHFPGSGASDSALAGALDGYCADVAGTRGLSWQYCVAALVWFVGTGGDSETKGKAR
jgi:hypothetical protein